MYEGKEDWVDNAIWSIHACDLERTVDDVLWEIDTSSSTCGEDIPTDSAQASMAASGACPQSTVCEESEALGSVLEEDLLDSLFFDIGGLEVCLLPTYLHALESIARNLGEGSLSVFLCYNQLVDFCPSGQPGLDPDHLGVFLTVFTDIMCIPLYDSFTLLYTAELISALDFVRVLSYFHDPRCWKDLVLHLCSCDGAQQRRWNDAYDYIWEADVNMFNNNSKAGAWADIFVPGLLYPRGVLMAVEESTILSQRRLATEQSTRSSLPPDAKVFSPRASSLSAEAPEFVPRHELTRPFRSSTPGDPVIAMEGWMERWRVHRMAAGLYDWDRVLAHPTLYKKAKRNWAQSLPPAERACFRSDTQRLHLRYQEMDTVARRKRGTSKRRRLPVRRKSRHANNNSYSKFVKAGVTTTTSGRHKGGRRRNQSQARCSLEPSLTHTQNLYPIHFAQIH